MVYQQFCIDSKYLVEQFFIIIFVGFSNRASGNISHRIKAYLFQFLRIASADSPEIRNWFMLPQKLSVRHLIQLCHSHSIFIRFGMLGFYIHGYFTQIQIRADTCCRCDSCFCINILDHPGCKCLGRQLICFQIRCCIDKNLIYGIYMDIFRCNVLQIYIIDSRTVFHIQCHSWGRGHITHSQFRRIGNLIRITGKAMQSPSRCMLLSLCIDLSDSLHNFKKPGSA